MMKEHFFPSFHSVIFSYILIFHKEELVNISILGDVLKTLIQIASYNLFCLDVSHILKEVNEEMYVVEVDLFSHINNIVYTVILDL